MAVSGCVSGILSSTVNITRCLTETLYCCRSVGPISPFEFLSYLYVQFGRNKMSVLISHGLQSCYTVILSKVLLLLLRNSCWWVIPQV